MCRRGRLFPSRGFTLIELVMVLAIIGVLAAVAAPRWVRSVSLYQADSAARRLAADLAWAQARARSISSSQTVNLNTGTGQYQFPGVADPDHPNSPYVVDLSQSPYFCAIVSASACDPNGNIVFDGYGSPATSGTVVIQSGEFQRTIVINSDAGTVSLQ